ncbi:hypothetical protein GQR58_004682 [Nymphon striatum]|nr:hypothetical protein GQR58_004682 [Nymphon striatum]
MSNLIASIVLNTNSSVRFSHSKDHLYHARLISFDLCFLNLKSNFLDMDLSKEKLTTKQRSESESEDLIKSEVGNNVCAWLCNKNINLYHTRYIKRYYCCRKGTFYAYNQLDVIKLSVEKRLVKVKEMIYCSTTLEFSHHILMLFTVLETVHQKRKKAKAEILGGPSLYLNSGSDMRLKCIVKDSPIGGPEYVFWHHNGNAIDYDSARGEVNLLTQKSTTTSILFIKNAKVTDSGNYSCNPSNASPATINNMFLLFLQGEHQAAMQDGNHNSSEKSPRTGGVEDLPPDETFLSVSVPISSVGRKTQQYKKPRRRQRRCVNFIPNTTLQHKVQSMRRSNITGDLHLNLTETESEEEDGYVPSALGYLETRDKGESEYSKDYKLSNYSISISILQSNYSMDDNYVGLFKAFCLSSQLSARSLSLTPMWEDVHCRGICTDAGSFRTNESQSSWSIIQTIRCDICATIKYIHQCDITYGCDMLKLRACIPNKISSTSYWVLDLSANEVVKKNMA